MTKKKQEQEKQEPLSEPDLSALKPTGKIKPCMACLTPKEEGVPCQVDTCIISPVHITAPADNLNRWDKLDEGRAMLLQAQDYLGHGVCSMNHPRIMYDNSGIDTAAVAPKPNGQDIQFYFNGHWLDKLTIEETSFVQAHESMHVLSGHLSMKNIEFPILMNLSADVLVNAWLIHEMKLPCSDRLRRILWDSEKIGWPNVQSLLDYVTAKDLYEELKKDAEKFKKLMKQAVEMALNGDIREAGKEYKDENGSPIDSHEAFSEIEQSVVDNILKELESNGTIKRAQKAGHLPAGMLREFNRIDQDFAWEHYVKMFMASIIKRVDTYERTHRLVGMDISPVIRQGERINYKYNLAAYTDMSGSIGPDEIGRMLSILQECPPEIQVHVYTFDTKIYEWIGWDKGTKPPGGGGTDFTAVVNHGENLKFEKIKCDGFIVLTDGQCSEPSPKQPKKWLWVSTDLLLTRQSGKWIKMPEQGSKKNQHRRHARQF